MCYQTYSQGEGKAFQFLIHILETQISIRLKQMQSSQNVVVFILCETDIVSIFVKRQSLLQISPMKMAFYDSCHHKVLIDSLGGVLI